MGPQWEQHIVAELDSSLNQFIDSVPEHRKCFGREVPLWCLIICKWVSASSVGPSERERTIYEPIRFPLRKLL